MGKCGGRDGEPGIVSKILSMDGWQVHGECEGCPDCKPAKEPCPNCGGDDSLLGYRHTACCETCGGTGRIPTTLQGSTTTQWHSKPCPDCKGEEKG